MGMLGIRCADIAQLMMPSLSDVFLTIHKCLTMHAYQLTLGLPQDDNRSVGSNESEDAILLL